MLEEALWCSFGHDSVHLFGHLLLNTGTAFDITVLAAMRCRVPSLIKLFGLSTLHFMTRVGKVGAALLDRAARAHHASIFKLILIIRSIDHGPIDASPLVEARSIDGCVHGGDSLSATRCGHLSAHLLDAELAIEIFT